LEELPVVLFHLLETREGEQFVKNLIQEQVVSLEVCKSWMNNKTSFSPSVSKMKVSVKARSSECILFWLSCQSESQVAHVLGNDLVYKFDLVIFEIKNRDVERRIAATCRLSDDVDIAAALTSDTNIACTEQLERKDANYEEPLFTIASQKLDIGGVQVGQTVRRSVRITSLCRDASLMLQVVGTDNLVDSIKSCRVFFVSGTSYDSCETELASQATTELIVEICPGAVRKFRQVFTIRGSKDVTSYQIPLEVLYFGYSKDSIRILESRDEESLYPFCTVADPSRRFAYIYHLHVVCDVQDCSRSILNAKSNLPSQIFIYSDAKLESIAENVPVVSGSAQELFLCVAPKFSEEDLIHCNAKRIIAGLQLSVCDEESRSILSERTWKVQGVVGIVRIDLKLSGSNFWIIHKRFSDNHHLECRGRLELKNRSCHFPTACHIVSPYFDVVLKGPSHNTLGCSNDGLSLMDTMDRNDEWIISQQQRREWCEYPSHVTIPYSFYPQETGYIVRNLYVESDAISFPVQVSFGCFVDDGAFQVKSPYWIESDCSLRIPICVRRKSDDTFATSQAFSFQLAVENDTNVVYDNLVILSTFVSLTDLTNTSRNNKALCLNGWNMLFYYCNMSWKDTENVLCIHHQLESLYLEKVEECFLRDHGFLEKKGFLILADARIESHPYNNESFVKKVIACTLYYECPEIVVVSENPISVGDIGPLSGCMERQVSIELENKSQFIVTVALLELPVALIPQFSCEDSSSNPTISFHPMERKTIPFLFDSERLDQNICGKNNLKLVLVNQMNEWNQLSLNIEFNYLKAQLQVSDEVVMMKTLKYPNGNAVEKVIQVDNLSPLDLVLDMDFQPFIEWTMETMPVELSFRDRENGNILPPEIRIEEGRSLQLLIRAIPKLASPWTLLEKPKEQNIEDAGMELGKIRLIPRQDEQSTVSIPLYLNPVVEALVLASPNKLILEHSSDLKQVITFRNPWTAATFSCRLESVSLPTFLQLHSTLEDFLLKPCSQFDFSLKLKCDLSAIISSNSPDSLLHLDAGHSCVFTVSIPDQVFSKLDHEQQKLLWNASSWDLENLFQIIIPIELKSSLIQQLVESTRQPTSSPSVDSMTYSRTSTPVSSLLLHEQDNMWMDPQQQQQLLLFMSQETESLPVLILRGCTSLPTNHMNNEVRYALDIGQVFIGQEPAPWTFVLETGSKVPLYYRIFIVTMEQDDTCWISLSKQEGVLNELHPMEEIEAYFSAFRMGYFHGYVRIENLSNPSDIIVVSVHMQVVAKLETAEQVKQQVFSVICDGRRSRQNVIDYSVVFFDHVYRHRSFVITNHSSVEQEFLLKHDLHTENKSELNFSLTNNSLRKVNSLHIRSGESARVFLYYRPALEVSDMGNTNNALMEMSKYDVQEFQREFHVFIHCRLVKDYQEVILVKSRCRFPRLQVSPVDQIFTMRYSTSESASNQSSSHGGEWFFHHPSSTSHATSGYSSTEEKDISTGTWITLSLNNDWYVIDPPYCNITIRNLSPTTTLHYRVMNHAFFFQVVENVEETLCTIPPSPNSLLSLFRGMESDSSGCSHTITIRVDTKALSQKQKILFKEKYLEEHISIYNEDVPKEFFWIRLRLSVDGTAKNFTAVMHKGTPAFETLEAIAQQLMKQVGNEFHQLYRQMNHHRNIFEQLRNHALEKDIRSSVEEDIASPPLWNKLQPILQDWTMDESHRPLMFQMHYVTDELTYYALKDPSDAALLLAKLVYSFIFHQPLFRWVLQYKEQLKETSFVVFWTGQLRHFLSFFPDKLDKLRPLYWLEEQFVPDQPSSSSNS